MNGRSCQSQSQRPLVRIDERVPLLGHIAFGIIDRGTNVLQVRPTSLCPLSCIFCSVDAGPRSRWRICEYMVDLDWLVEWLRALVKLKGGGVEILIDTVGDPFTYPELVDLVAEAKGIPGVVRVTVETHGPLLSEKVIDDLADAGLTRINLSIDTMDPEKARFLAGAEWYDLRRVLELATYALDRGIDVHVTPVWLPGVNDEDIPRIIEWALKVGCGRTCPPLGIQKYVAHRHGRKPKGVREPSWEEFREFLRGLEERFGVKLLLSMEDYGMRPAPQAPIIYREGDVVKATVIAKGWLRREVLAVPRDGKRCLTIVSADWLEPGDTVKARILRCKDNIYVAKPL